jgi:biopolymer transport protein ExbB
MEQEGTAGAAHELDPTGGVDTLKGLIDAGGPVVVILLVMSVAALAVILAKLLAFRRARLGEGDVVRQAAAAVQRGERPAVPDGPTHPAMALVAAALEARRRGLDRDALREELLRVGRGNLAALRSHFRMLEVIAALAPLLGLFGTVLGMIDAFRALERAGGSVDPAILSGGIWQALLTTAIGLAVAMPVVAALGWLDRCVERTAETMDDVTARLLALPPVATAWRTVPGERPDVA